MKKFKKISFLLVLLVLFVGGVMAWWLNGISPVDSLDTSRKVFSIKQGEGVRAVANNLKDEGLIRDDVIFFLVVRQLGLDQKIQAGDFRLSPSMSSVEIARALQIGTYDVQIIIPEGKRAEEIADILRDRVETYDESWRTRLIAEEGYLFPDTYSLSKDVTIDQVIEIMTNNFEEKYAEINQSGRSGLTKEDIVTVASLVEREAKHGEDRPLVASVILNRLRINMPLQIDATVQYVLGYQDDEKNWWKSELTFDDLEVSSPYNTYRNPGLPPGPIANPGFEVLNAVVNPADTDYLFYISDKSGNNHYARTLEEHNANIERYGL